MLYTIFTQKLLAVTTFPSCSTSRHHLFLSPANTRVLLIKDNKRSLHSNVAKQRKALHGLDATKALLALVVSGTVVDQQGGHLNPGVADTKGKVGDGLGAVIGDGGNVAVVVGTGDLGPVLLDGAVGEKDQAGAGVGDTGVVGVNEAVADAVAGGSEAPVAAGLVEGSVGNGSLVLRVINEAKVVVSV